MNRLAALLTLWAQKLRKYISPVFLALLAVSFTLWYISKLNYTYTTDFEVDVDIDGTELAIPCMVKGKGTALFGYAIYTSKSANLSLSELKYDSIPIMDASDTVVLKYQARILPASMLDALSKKFSDLEITSLGTIPDIDFPKK